MRREERVESANEALLAALEGHEAGMWVALPGIVQSFDPTKATCVVQPAIQARVRSKDDVTPPIPGAQLDEAPWWWVTMPLLVDVPVVFPGGGGWSITFPIAVGDEALVIFASRCIDAWWQSGKVDIQADLRMHDLSDGFAIVGPRSLPRKPNPAISTTAVELRNDAGTVKLKIASDGTSVEIVAPAIKLGNGGALKKLINDTFVALFNAHTHGGVLAGGGVTGVPVVPLNPPVDGTETTVLTAQ